VKTANRKMMVGGIFLGLILLLGGGSVLHAHFGPQWGHGYVNPEKHAARICEHLTKQLDLDESQQQELETMAQDLLEKGSSLHQLRATGRQEVLSILRADSLDRQQVERLVAQHREEIDELISAVGSRLTDFVEMLSPEQRERLAKAIEDHAGCTHFPKD